MHKLTIKHLETGKLKDVTFTTKDEMELYKNYHTVFHGWDKPQKWVLERFLKEEERKHIVTTQERIGQNKKPQTWYLIRPEWNFVSVKELDTKEYNWEAFRLKRDLILSSTDYTQLADSPLDSKIRQLYREYRQFLRNLTLNYNDETINDAKVMSFDEWSKFFNREIR